VPEHQPKNDFDPSNKDALPCDAICIVGAGAIGVVMTTILSTLCQPYLLARRAQIEELQTSSLTLTGDLSLSTKSFSVISTRQLSSLPPRTAYFLCVKSHQISAALEEIRPYVSGETSLFLLSNGLSVFLEASDILPVRPQLYRMLCYFGASNLDSGAPSKVHVSGRATASLTALQEYRESLQLWIRLLESTSLLTIFTEKNVVTAEWNKITTNIIVNSLATLANRENSVVLSSPPLKILARNIFDELTEIAKAEGHHFSEDKFNSVLEGIKNHAGNINSTLVDFRRGKKSEIETLIGRVLQIAGQYDVNAPCITTLYHLLSATEALQKKAS
jgi:2-dehydropantoate 2-reductase